jgi:transposase
VKQFLAELPTRLTAQCQGRAPDEPIKVFAQDESRVGLLPIVRRRITACGVQPIATVAHTFDNFYLYGAVEPTTGESFFLELPWLNASVFQLWVDHFADAFPQSFNLLVLDNSACHTAKAIRWPSHVAPVFLPPYSPELNPIERLWRDLKDKLAGSTAMTIDELSEAVCTLIRSYAPATLQSLTSFAYFVQAVEAARKTTYV